MKKIPIGFSLTVQQLRKVAKSLQKNGLLRIIFIEYRENKKKAAHRVFQRHTGCLLFHCTLWAFQESIPL